MLLMLTYLSVYLRRKAVSHLLLMKSFPSLERLRWEIISSSPVFFPSDYWLYLVFHGLSSLHLLLAQWSTWKLPFPVPCYTNFALLLVISGINLCLYVCWCSLLQKLVIVPSKKDLGLAFKGNQKMVLEALEVPCLAPCPGYMWL